MASENRHFQKKSLAVCKAFLLLSSVPRSRFELPCPFRRHPLKMVRLPISPPRYLYRKNRIIFDTYNDCDLYYFLKFLLINVWIIPSAKPILGAVIFLRCPTFMIVKKISAAGIITSARSCLSSKMLIRSFKEYEFR